MPKGPHGEKRPADVIGLSVKVMRIATVEEEEAADSAKSGGGGTRIARRQARAAKMTPERRAEIAREAAARRWAKPAR